MKYVHKHFIYDYDLCCLFTKHRSPNHEKINNYKKIFNLMSYEIFFSLLQNAES